MVTIKISTANEAFDSPGPEIARILRTLAYRVEDGELLHGIREIKIQDVNGDTVGSFKYTNK